MFVQESAVIIEYQDNRISEIIHYYLEKVTVLEIYILFPEVRWAFYRMNPQKKKNKISQLVNVLLEA